MWKTIVVFPCYNEALRLKPDVFSAFLHANREMRFLFVNDASTDDTAACLERIISEAPPGSAEFIQFDKNLGKAEAVRRGFLHAIERDEFECIGFMDSDLATPLSEIDYLTEPILTGKYEIVFGSRVALFGHHIHRSRMRHYPGRIFATLASHTLDMTIYDTQCGAKFFRNGLDLQTIFDEPFFSGWCFDVEMIARLKALGHYNGVPFEKAILEKPLREWFDIKGSKVNALDFFRSLPILYKIRKNVLKK